MSHFQIYYNHWGKQDILMRKKKMSANALRQKHFLFDKPAELVDFLDCFVQTNPKTFLQFIQHYANVLFEEREFTIKKSFFQKEFNSLKSKKHVYFHSSVIDENVFYRVYAIISL